MDAQGIKGFRELEPNNLVSEVVSFIEEKLPSFTGSKEFVDILELKKNENKHSSAFCVFMTNQCKSRFYFERECSQKGSSTIDIGVYKDSELFFTIEAKVLPTPKGTKSAPRNEHEYVYGKGAGIQRFKDENHGLDNRNNLLVENGLIAYLKENDYQYWLNAVNQWIIDASWKEKEKLKMIYFGSIARLESRHQRKHSSEVFLHHFWVDVSQKKDPK